MAKAQYDCPQCGNTITIHGRNRRDADYQASVATRVCDDCSRKAFDAANAVAAAAAVEAGLPTLVGTPKQVAWAETVRKTILDRLSAASVHLDGCYAYAPGYSEADANTDRGDDEDLGAQRARQYARADFTSVANGMRVGSHRDHNPSSIWRIVPNRAAFDLFARVLREQDDASWWIDHRSDGPGNIAADLCPKLAAAHAAAQPGAAEQAALEAEVKAEALLLPACELAGQRIAEVSYKAPYLSVAYEVKNEALRELVKSRGFAWDNISWKRKLDARHGDPVHRVAETAHLLLAKGFQVRVMDNAARALAVSGEFEPEQTRWLMLLLKGDSAGWFRASWARFEDYYDAARRVPGSKYESGQGVLYPPGAVTEAVDFAERHGFTVSDGVRKALAAHEAELATGVVVDAKMRKVAAPSQARPVLTATEGGVDADLLDND